MASPPDCGVRVVTTRLEPTLGRPVSTERRDAALASEAKRPPLPAPAKGRAEIVAQPAPPPAQLPPPVERANLRDMSPRELADLTYEFYLNGTLSWEEYRLVGFPSELNPAYDRTIGALVEERAQPDRRRDMIAEWEDRVDYAKRHHGDDPDHVSRAERILGVLKWHELPPVRLVV